MKTIFSVAILCVSIYIIASLVTDGKSRITIKSSKISDIHQKYPDSVRVITIDGDTATIYNSGNLPGHGIRLVKKK